MVRVAVSGVGGGSGQGIVKALKRASYEYGEKIDIYPVDVTPISAGLYSCGGKGSVLPRPEEDAVAWGEWLQAKKIDVLIGGADRDLMPLAEHRDEWSSFCNVVVSDPNLIGIGDHKFVTSEWLRKNDFDYPKSLITFARSEVPPIDSLARYGLQFPLIVKPAVGAASRDVHYVADEEELSFYWRRTPGGFAQEYLDGDEYTCSVFSSKPGQVDAVCVMKRWLYVGNTYRAQVVDDSDIISLVTRVGEKFGARGPLNIQLRRTSTGRIVPFEFNVRCSGSTAIRAHFGYNEPLMILNAFVRGETIHQPLLEVGGFCYRYWDEMFLSPNSTLQMFAGQIKDVKAEIPSWM